MSDSRQPPADADLFTPSASRLATLFYNDLNEIGDFELITADKLPGDNRGLLAHNDHMTVALEAFHDSLVAVHAVDEWRDDASYARCSVLTRRSDDAIVQFGMMRIWLADLPESAQEEITSKKVPLGRVLIRHNVLREVELIAFWKITPGPVLKEHLKLTDSAPIYGRSAQILLDERPTVQLLEIVKLENDVREKN